MEEWKIVFIWVFSVIILAIALGTVLDRLDRLIRASERRNSILLGHRPGD